MTLATETDSFPRIFARDLFLVLRVFDQNAETSLENIRLRICVDRKKQRRGTFLWSVASDAAGELVRLGLIEGSCHAKNAQQYKVVKANRLRVTAEGGTLLQTYRSDRARAYDRLLELLSASHAYLRRLIVVLNREMILAPVISSMRDHVSLRYATNVALAEDVAKGQFDYDSLLALLAGRVKRDLGQTEKDEIHNAVEKLVADSMPGAVVDDTTRLGAALLRRRLFRLFIGVFARGRSLFGSFCAGTAPRTAPTRLFRAASPA